MVTIYTTCVIIWNSSFYPHNIDVFFVILTINIDYFPEQY
jgi:hypothetical protein